MRNRSPQALQDRLLEFASAVCRSIQRMRRDAIGVHIAKQLLRSATSPMANYAEARSAESRRDFVHKVQICLKELREVSVWLHLATRLGPRYLDDADLQRECEELIAIFVATVTTAKSSRRST